jgi:hypothetical protein
MTTPAPVSPAGPSSSAGETRHRRTCYVCRGYSFTGQRHPDCTPKYRRARLSTCDRCGRLSVGKRHRACGDNPRKPCRYCGELTKGTYHNRCQPVALGALALFPDDPFTVQRKCSDCGEWFPFASVDGNPASAETFWNRHGRAPGGRPLFDGMCKGCKAERRRGHGGQRVDTSTANAILRDRDLYGIAEAAERNGVSVRTVYRYARTAA